MPKPIDIAGRRYSRLIAIRPTSPVGIERKGRFWLCICDCGNHTVVSAGYLNFGKTKSCGCLQKQRSREFGSSRIRPDSAFQLLFREYKRNAETQRRCFSLSQEQFKTLTSSSCHYCGAPPSGIKKCGMTGRYIYSGIDRIDSGAGYVDTNCVPCCWSCNRLKGTFKQEEFLKAIMAISAHQWKISL